MQRILLASGSPRRLELLRQVGFAPTVKTAPIDEVADSALRSDAWVQAIAEKKAAAAKHLLGDLPLGLAADTTVWLEDGERLEKPADARDAVAMLRVLSGKTHFVSTGVCLWTSSASTSFSRTTTITFDTLTDANIEAYVATGDPLDKAGGYGIQGFAGLFVSRIEGCYFNVVGLPLFDVQRAACELLGSQSMPWEATR